MPASFGAPSQDNPNGCEIFKIESNTRNGTLVMNTELFVGIDVSKAWLDIAVSPNPTVDYSTRLANDEAGHVA